MILSIARQSICWRLRGRPVGTAEPAPFAPPVGTRLCMPIFHGLSLRIARSALAVACIGLAWPSAAKAEANGVKRVLIINSFSGENAPFDIFGAQFRADLAQLVTPPIAFYETTLDGARFDPAHDTTAFVSFLRERFAKRPPELVVPIGPLAAQFYARNRERLFPEVPMLVAAAEQRMMSGIALGPKDGSLSLSLDIRQVFDNILQLLPETQRIVVVVGDAPIERYWVQVIQQVAAAYAGRVTIELMDKLSLAEVEKRVAALPANSAVLFPQMYVDGAGASQQQDHTLSRLHSASRAPVFGHFASQLGKGIVGGPLMPERIAATRVAQVASAMLNGDLGAARNAQPVTLAAPAYDWRELQRWRIAESRLPPGSQVRFRPPTLWQQYRWLVIAGLAALLLQSALLGGLLLQRARRRRAESEAQSLSGRILTAHEDERRRLARELHDDITPRLARLAIDAVRLAPAAGAASMQAELASLSKDVHGFSYRLHPTVLDDLGLADALRAECERIASGQQIDVGLEARGVPENLPREVAVCLYRIAQEALRNIVRHARARTVRVALLPKDQGLQLSVVDDGNGFDTDALFAKPSLGHASMRERVRLLGGRLQLRSVPGQGCSVVAWVPLAEVKS